MIYEKLFATSHAQVLRFLARNAGRSFYEREIVESTGVSRSAVNLAANALYKAGFLRRERRGRMNFYAANDRHPFYLVEMKRGWVEQRADKKIVPGKAR